MLQYNAEIIGLGCKDNISNLTSGIYGFMSNKTLREKSKIKSKKSKNIHLFKKKTFLLFTVFYKQCYVAF